MFDIKNFGDRYIELFNIENTGSIKAVIISKAVILNGLELFDEIDSKKVIEISKRYLESTDTPIDFRSIYYVFICSYSLWFFIRYDKMFYSDKLKSIFSIHSSVNLSKKLFDFYKIIGYYISSKIE